MRGSISSVESRDARDFIIFELDERSFNPEGARVISKHLSIDGTGLTTDWGYPYSNITITATDFFLSKEDYDDLIDMKEDDDNSFLFHYRNRSYKVAIQSVRGIREGDKVLMNTLNLSVISRLPDGETS